jgi:hypothetical protein
MKAKQRASDLEDRMTKRLDELSLEKRVYPLPPLVIGAAVIIPIGLIEKQSNRDKHLTDLFSRDTKRIEQIAMNAIMEIERGLGYYPRDISASKCGYDIESKTTEESSLLRFIEVKGRIKGADTVTVTKNEILTSLNKPDQYILAIVEVDGEIPNVHYIKKPFASEPGFALTS